MIEDGDCSAAPRAGYQGGRRALHNNDYYNNYYNYVMLRPAKAQAKRM
jgi:hypothetical protein